MRIFAKVTDLIGKTPLLQLSNFEKEYNLNSKIIAKIESFNPAGSAKDRVALAMLDDAQEKGLINKDTIITSKKKINTFFYKFKIKIFFL